MNYSDRSGCKQCPEYCRIVGYGGDCGIMGGAGVLVDCGVQSCPDVCRVSNVTEIPVQEPPGVCQAYVPDLPCQGCPALCRRNNDVPEPNYKPQGPCPQSVCGRGQADSVTYCSDECRLPDAPDRMCEGCFDCPYDCLYYPAVRTDCSELCTDESLAGPVNVAPDDFIKKLPGATGAPDVMGLGALMVPSLVMPLFCIVITIAFVRSFSQILGGDIEIPGLGKII